MVKMGRPMAKWASEILAENINKLPVDFRIKDIIDLLFEHPEYSERKYRIEYMKIQSWVSRKMKPKYRVDSNNNIPFSYYSRDELMKILSGV